MAAGADLVLDDGKLAADGDKLVRAYLTAGTLAVGEATRRLEQRLEAATRASAGGNLWRAWRSSAFPKRGPARSPTGTVYLNGDKRTRGAIKFWTEPGQVRGKDGQYLAIPLPAAGKGGRYEEALSPGDWERRTGRRLRFVYRKGRASLLVADGAGVTRAGQFRRGAAGNGGTGRGATVPIFVLIPMVQHRNAFAIAPLVNQSEAELVSLFIAGAGAVG